MFTLPVAGGIFLLDYKIKEKVDSTRLQGSKEEVLGGHVILRNCHNKDTVFGKVKIGAQNCQELSPEVHPLLRWPSYHSGLQWL